MNNKNEINTQPELPFGDDDLSVPLAGDTDLATENANLKAAIRLRDARDAVTEELRNSGARSPVLLWDVVAGDVEFDDAGKPTNIAAILAELKASFPEQFGTQTDSGQIPGTYIPQSIDAGAGQTATPRLTKEALRRMKPAEIAELDWADVRRVLAS